MTEFVPPTIPHSFAFHAFGSTLRIDSNDAHLLELARAEAVRGLIGKLEFTDPDSAEPDRTYGLYADGEIYRLFENGEQITYGEAQQNFLHFFNAILRVAVGEHSSLFTFLHAGVVGWRGKAIVMPANSFNGKTTLVAELVKCGAEYYSDEYAVIEADGLVHPFERDLSVRHDGARSKGTPVTVGSIGGRSGSEPLPVGMLLLTKYEPEASFQPERISLGTGIIETIPFAIPVLNDPDRTMKHLGTALKDSVIIKTPRGEASETAANVLAYLDGDG